MLQENVKNVKKEEVIDEIIQYFEENKHEFEMIIEELDSWNGFLDSDRIYDMEELDEYMNGIEPLELARKIFYGYDERTFRNEYGREEHESFNPNQPYFKFNGYGNLVSLYEKDYSIWLDEYFIKELADNWNRMGLENEELADMLWLYQRAEENERD